MYIQLVQQCSVVFMCKKNFWFCVRCLSTHPHHWVIDAYISTACHERLCISHNVHVTFAVGGNDNQTNQRTLSNISHEGWRNVKRVVRLVNNTRSSSFQRFVVNSSLKILLAAFRFQSGFGGTLHACSPTHPTHWSPLRDASFRHYTLFINFALNKHSSPSIYSQILHNRYLRLGLEIELSLIL